MGSARGLAQLRITLRQAVRTFAHFADHTSYVCRVFVALSFSGSVYIYLHICMTYICLKALTVATLVNPFIRLSHISLPMLAACCDGRSFGRLRMTNISG